MRRVFIFFLIFNGHFCIAQDTDFKEVSKITDRIPRAHENSTQAIAGYIRSQFKNPEDQLKAAFYWTATNIDYAVEDIQRGTAFESVDELINAAMLKKRGLCQAYSEIFNELARHLHFESHVISGYVRQNGVVTRDYGHAWNAVKLEKKWYLFDPTWAAGHFLLSGRNRVSSKSNYVKQFTPTYFKVQPEKFIKSHMPFDPVWQLSDQTITYRDFDQSRFQKGFRAKFNYQNTIARLATESDLEHLENSIKRIESLGSGNRLVKNNLHTLRRNREIAITNADGEIYNQALAHHADGINFFNDYVELFNNKDIRFSDKIKQLKLFLFKAEKTAQKAQSIYNSISTSNPTLKLNIVIKKGEITNLFEKIEQEKNYLSRL